MEKTEQNIGETVAVHSQQIKSLEKRMAKCEAKDEVLNKLAISVEKMATVQQGMLEEQKTQRKDINELKEQPARKHEFMWKEAVKVAISVIGGAILGALVGLIIKG